MAAPSMNSAKAILSQETKPCFVCSSPTRRIRSASHLNGPPSLPQDFMRICIACDEDWTLAVTRDLIDNPPKKKP